MDNNITGLRSSIMEGCVEQDKVYIVTEGDYSDYHIIAVFFTRGEAEGFTNGGEKVESEFRSPNIEEWKVGPPDLTKFYQRMWHVSLWPDGSVYNTSVSWDMQPKGYTKVTTVPDVCEWDKKRPWQYCCTADSTVSEEHAMKLAVEARQAWIVRNPQ
jgi:hypothetical protein